MKKKTKNTIYWIISAVVVVALIAVIIYLAVKPEAKSILNNQTEQISLNNQQGGGSNTNQGNSVVTCQSIAQSNGRTYFNSPIATLADCGTYASNDCPRIGKVANNIGWNDDLDCCIWNCVASSCVDSDGDDRDTPGHVTYNGNEYYDQCLEVGQGVTEYICNGNVAQSKNWACDLGEVCMQTRSGGHCIPAPHTWNPGDVVFAGGGSGEITGGTVPVGASIDLSDYGFEPGGTCRLGVKLTIDWVYATGTPTCTGVQGMEGLKWEFFDSNGLEWSVTDAFPHPPQVYNLHPENNILEWDGVNLWRGQVSKTLNLPACNIAYNYFIEIYVWDC